MWVFFFQAEDGIRGLVRSRGLGDVYKRQGWGYADVLPYFKRMESWHGGESPLRGTDGPLHVTCLLYTSDAADDLLCVDLGGRRIIKKKNPVTTTIPRNVTHQRAPTAT